MCVCVCVCVSVCVKCEVRSVQCASFGMNLRFCHIYPRFVGELCHIATITNVFLARSARHCRAHYILLMHVIINIAFRVECAALQIPCCASRSRLGPNRDGRVHAHHDTSVHCVVHLRLRALQTRLRPLPRIRGASYIHVHHVNCFSMLSMS